jgi:hypothetical protein
MERDPVNPTDDYSASNDGMMDFFDAPSDKDLRNQWNSRGGSNDLAGVCVTPSATSASEKPKFSMQSLLERMMKISPMKIPLVQINMADEDDKAIVFDDETRSLV